MDFGDGPVPIYPVFANVYSLGSSSAIRSADAGLKMLNTGIFHAGCEVHGCEYSFGGNGTKNATGLMRTSPKCCGMHEYLQTIYVGDTTYNPTEVENFLRCRTMHSPLRINSFCRRSRACVSKCRPTPAHTRSPTRHIVAEWELTSRLLRSAACSATGRASRVIYPRRPPMARSLLSNTSRRTR